MEGGMEGDRGRERRERREWMERERKGSDRE